MDEIPLDRQKQICRELCGYR